MAYGDEDDDGIASGGRGGSVDARRDVDVEAGLLGYQVFLEYAVKAFPVVFGQENVVCCELGKLLVKGPVEGDAGA